MITQIISLACVTRVRGYVVQHFRQELKEQKGKRRGITARIRRLQRLMVQHYLLIGLSLVQSGMSLFIVTNYPGPYRPVLLVLAVVSFALTLGLLSGLAK